MKIFISYSWDNEEHKNWVLNLADLLTKNGLYVLLDQYDLKAGKNMNLFMENAIRESSKVLIILTPNYKLKAEKRKGGVGYEYSICTQNLFENQSNNKRFIPILRKGSLGESVPSYLKVFTYHDMTFEIDFESCFNGLLRLLYNKPLIKRPQIGNKPDFDSADLADINKSEFVNFNQMIKESVINMQKKSKTNSFYSISSGYKDLDYITSGFNDGNLIVIGGRPGMGITSFALSLIHNNAINDNRSVGFFTLESSKIHITNKLLSIVTQIPFVHLNNGKLLKREWIKLDNAVKKVVDIDLFISDKQFIDIKDIKNKFKQLSKKHNIDLIIIDSLSSINFTEPHSLNNKIIESLFLQLKDLTIELNIPIIITTKVNKSNEIYGNKRPKMIDLPNYEIIERLADLIIFIHRPEEYGFLEDEDGNSLKDIAEFIVIKNRLGLSGYCCLKLNKELGFYKDVAPNKALSFIDLKTNNDFDNNEAPF
jgi:KaiC/GvpD/RAD55 family RecA-like ATPase